MLTLYTGVHQKNIFEKEKYKNGIEETLSGLLQMFDFQRFSSIMCLYRKSALPAGLFCIKIILKED